LSFNSMLDGLSVLLVVSAGGATKAGGGAAGSKAAVGLGAVMVAAVTAGMAWVLLAVELAGVLTELSSKA
jgi:hypothetical protein